ncbi:tripartite tricarboxylate transporter substrate binding protein [Alkalihalobacillus deserti]|uniref:tripartite tricarboxylate transporter substrate binding protein n=1 Tax=Alkalihalobacillus deserti TaxID=2879466 RepID=UPI001D154599|nr:tripartite tricarboxylate transporter substrate binding protein [Alkalihalobacillus deserti]
MKKNILLFLLILILFLVGCSQNAEQSSGNQPSDTEGEQQQPTSDFPVKPIEMIVPAPAGGSTDIIARILTKAVSEHLPNKQNVVVINQSGGNNTIGISDVFKAKPDGYTIGFVPSSPITNEPHFGNTPYTHDSFQTVMRVAQQDGFLYVRTDSPWETYEEWFDFVEQNPGKFRIGTVAGVRNLLQRINHDADIDITVVPYDGFAEATTALLGEHVEGVFAIPAAVKAQLDSGEFRPIFSSSGRQIGDTALLKDKGFEIEENRMTGIIAPKGLPEEELMILHDAFKKVLEDPAVIEELKKINLEPYYGSPEEFQKALTEGFKVDGETLRIVGQIE